MDIDIFIKVCFEAVFREKVRLFYEVARGAGRAAGGTTGVWITAGAEVLKSVSGRFYYAVAISCKVEVTKVRWWLFMEE